MFTLSKGTLYMAMIILKYTYLNEIRVDVTRHRIFRIKGSRKSKRLLKTKDKSLLYQGWFRDV